MTDHTLPVLAFLDVETTGLSPQARDRVVEIAILRAQGDRVEHAWSSLVNPCRPIGSASAIHGITDDMVAGSPQFHEIAATVLELVSDAVVVIHNAPFDLSFLSSELNLCGRVLPDLRVIDTLRIARTYFRFPSNKLGNLASTFSVEVKDAHRAMADVRTTHKVFQHLHKDLCVRNMGTLDHLMMTQAVVDNSREKVRVHPLIEEAIRRGGSVSLDYNSSSGEVTRRVVRPLRLIPLPDGLWLEAFCTLKNERRTFRLDRILQLIPLPASAISEETK